MKDTKFLQGDKHLTNEREREKRKRDKELE
jgi:hypothetical protein